MRKFSLILMCFLLPGLQAQSNSAAYVDFPEACFAQKKYPCTMKTISVPLQMEISENQYLLGQDSSLQFQSQDVVQLLKGKVYLNFQKNSELRLNPNISVKFSGEVFLEKTSDAMMKMKNLNAQIEFESRHVFASEALPTGFENWYGPLAENGQILRGVMRPIDKESFISAWMPMVSLPVTETRRKMKQYLDLWSGAVEQSAQLYQEVAQRRLASDKEKIDREEQKQRKKDEEKDQLRRLYREKNGL